MKTFYRYLTLLLLLDILCSIIGYVLINWLNVSFLFSDLAWLLFSFSIIAAICLFIFFKGQKKDPAGRTMYLMVAFGLKMLLEMILALFWFFIGKKNTLSSLLLFFLLYLAFTLFSASAMLKSLKIKSLENLT